MPAADLWFIQPEAYKSHSIRSDSSWSTWTHTGSSYAALVVRPGFDLVPSWMCCTLGGYVSRAPMCLGCSAKTALKRRFQFLCGGVIEMKMGH